MEKLLARIEAAIKDPALDGTGCLDFDLWRDNWQRFSPEVAEAVAESSRQAAFRGGKKQMMLKAAVEAAAAYLAASRSGSALNLTDDAQGVGVLEGNIGRLGAEAVKKIGRFEEILASPLASGF